MKINFNIKNKKPLFFLLLILFVTVISSTYAYYYQEFIIPNKFKTMTYNVVLNTDFNGSWGTYKATVSNNESTNTAVVLRVHYVESWTKEVNGAYLVLSNQKNGEDVVTKNWTSDFTTDFVKQSDGWYYYKKLLKPQTSVVLLDGISLNTRVVSPENTEDDYNKYDYNLGFKIEAIQATEKAVSNIWSKEIEIDGDDVEWV